WLVVPRRHSSAVVLCAVWLMGAGAGIAAQQLVDRVVARVNGIVVFLSDVRAAVGFGLIEAGEDAAQVHEIVQRLLLLGEVSRFPPPDPAPDDVAAEVARMKARVPNAAVFLTTHGLTESDVVSMARDTLRIQTYLAQRFGPNMLVSEEAVLEYYKAHPAEFMRDGVPQPFPAVQSVARERASAERRREAVAQWLRDLEGRAEVSTPK
ncbi:MAG TPA: hypothetical protein VIY56_05415, partial [Vicinamibacterales bacterium]